MKNKRNASEFQTTDLAGIWQMPTAEQMEKNKAERDAKIAAEKVAFEKMVARAKKAAEKAAGK